MAWGPLSEPYLSRYPEPIIGAELHLAREAGSSLKSSSTDVDVRSFDRVRHIGRDRLSHSKSDSEMAVSPRDTGCPPFADTRDTRTRDASHLGDRLNT